MCRVWDVNCGVWGFVFRVSGFGFSGFGFRVPDFRCRMSGVGFRVSDIGFGFRVSLYKAVQISVLGFSIQVLWFKVWGVGCKRCRV